MTTLSTSHKGSILRPTAPGPEEGGERANRLILARIEPREGTCSCCRRQGLLTASSSNGRRLYLEGCAKSMAKKYGAFLYTPSDLPNPKRSRYVLLELVREFPRAHVYRLATELEARYGIRIPSKGVRELLGELAQEGVIVRTSPENLGAEYIVNQETEQAAAAFGRTIREARVQRSLQKPLPIQEPETAEPSIETEGVAEEVAASAETLASPLPVFIPSRIFQCYRELWRKVWRKWSGGGGKPGESAPQNTGDRAMVDNTVGGGFLPDSVAKTLSTSLRAAIADLARPRSTPPCATSPPSTSSRSRSRKVDHAFTTGWGRRGR